MFYFVSVGDLPPRDMDLAIASRCNHTVYDYGSFGFWGAFLAGGKTVLAKNINGKGKKVEKLNV